eukprot:6750699-Heterocapsa_arctica.AAC.1
MDTIMLGKAKIEKRHLDMPIGSKCEPDKLGERPKNKLHNFKQWIYKQRKGHMDPRSWCGQYCQTTYSGKRGNGPISKKNGETKMTHSHEDSTQEKTDNCKSHTYCTGNRGKNRTTYGGNKCKDPRLGKTSKEKT